METSDLAGSTNDTGRDENALLLGIDLGTSRSSIVSMRGSRKTVASYVGWAREEGYRIIGIISNGRMLAYPGVARRLAARGVNRFTISSSGREFRPIFALFVLLGARIFRPAAVIGH